MNPLQMSHPTALGSVPAQPVHCSEPCSKTLTERVGGLCDCMSGVVPGDYSLSQLQDDVWTLSKAASAGDREVGKLKGRILEINDWLEKRESDIAQALHCQTSDIRSVRVTLPRSTFSKVIDVLTLPFRVAWVALRLVVMLPIFGLMSLFFRNDHFEPKHITNGKTPVLLIHGSNANQRQWDAFRHFLGGDECGHVFSINLNDSPYFNDRKDMEAYARDRIGAKIEKMTKMYQAAGLDLDEVILVGHSMGGLVAGAYASRCQDHVKVKAIVSVSTPWNGSPVADALFREDAKPEGAFVSQSQATRQLREDVLEKAKNGQFGLYTFSGSLDEVVPMRSSSLPINPMNQIYSNHDDHLTPMCSRRLARRIRDEWIAVHTAQLRSC